MNINVRVNIVASFLCIVVFTCTACGQQTETKHNLGNGLTDYGVAVPYASMRGTVTTVNQEGDKIALVWLSDHRGTYSLLMVNLDKSKSRQFFLPFTGHSYTSLLSANNCYYTQFKGHFVEFDPNKPGFTFMGKTPSGNAMSMTEDKQGVIWSALYPNGGLISYNIEGKQLKKYGSVYQSKAQLKPRSIVASEEGKVYILNGKPGKEQVVVFDANTGSNRVLDKLGNFESGKNSLRIGINKNVVVQGKGKKKRLSLRRKSNKFEVNASKKSSMPQYITGNQALFEDTFPDGSKILSHDPKTNRSFLQTKELTLVDANGQIIKSVPFDYKTEGASVIGVIGAGGGKLIGTTQFPFTIFQLDVSSNNWKREKVYGQFNAFIKREQSLFIGEYPHGELIKFDFEKNWERNKRNRLTNIERLIDAYPGIRRPKDVLLTSNGSKVVMAGRPVESRIGSGLLIWDISSQSGNYFDDNDIFKNQSTLSLTNLPGGRILSGTNIYSDAGVRKRDEAELYIMDLGQHKIEWRGAVIPKATRYNDLVYMNGYVFGIADRKIFFVFDPDKKKLLKSINLKEKFGSEISYSQGQRVLVPGPDNQMFLLLKSGIVEISSDSFTLDLLVKVPDKIDGGGAYSKGKIYFVSKGGSHIYSYDIEN